MIEEISRCLICFENWNPDRFFIYACGAFVCKTCHLKLFIDNSRSRCINCKIYTGARDHIISGPILINTKEIENKKLVQCDYDGCEEKLLMKDLYKHQDECLYKLLSCQKCNLEFLQMDILIHNLNCECRDIICECCKAMFPFNKS
jgi:hypothetical protein